MVPSASTHSMSRGPPSTEDTFRPGEHHPGLGCRDAVQVPIGDRGRVHDALEQPHEHQTPVTAVTPVEVKYELIKILRQGLNAAATLVGPIEKALDLGKRRWTAGSDSWAGRPEALTLNGPWVYPVRARGYDCHPSAATIDPASTFALTKAPSEAAEASGITASRARPHPRDRPSITPAASVLPADPRPPTPVRWPPMKVSSISTRPESGSHSAVPITGVSSDRVSTASGPPESLRPAQPVQVVQARCPGRKPGPQLGKISRIVPTRGQVPRSPVQR